MKKVRWLGKVAVLCLSLFLSVGNMTVYAKSSTPRIQWKNVNSKFTAKTGTRKTLKVKVNPSKAGKKLKWSSSNKKVATVSSKGVVTFKKKGKVTITCKLKTRPSKKVKCKITVKKGKAAFSSSSISLWTGDSKKMKPVNVVGKTIQYSSSDKNIAIVSSGGTVKAKNAGTVTITAKIKDGTVSSGSYKVKVTRRINADDTNFIAHRGLSSEAPENSKPAFKLAAKSGYWGIETDVRITKDNEFVISHDESLQRMCDEDKSISDLTLAQVRKILITQGSNQKQYEKDKDAMTIPTLKEYLKTCKKYQVVPVIEVKWAVKENGYVTIFFKNPDGSSVESVDDLSGKSGEKISDTAMPKSTREGYSVKWYEKLDDNGNPAGKEIKSLPKYYPTRNITYYAAWEVDETSESVVEPVDPQKEMPKEVPEDQVDELEGNILTADDVTVTNEDDQAIKGADGDTPVAGESGDLSVLQEVKDEDIDRLYQEVKSVMGDSQVVFIAFNYQVLTLMKEEKENDENALNASFQYLYSGNDCNGAVNRCKEDGFGFDVSAAVCSPTQVRNYRSMGVPVNVWTINSRNKAYSYIEQGVSNITTNSKFW